MKKFVSYALPFVAMGIVALVAWPVYAHCGVCAASAKDMVKAMDESNTTLPKAIAMAEEHCKGRAVGALTAAHEGEVEIQVFCLVGEKLQEVEIDAKTGKVKDVEDVRALPKFEHGKAAAKAAKEHEHEHEEDEHEEDDD